MFIRSSRIESNRFQVEIFRMFKTSHVLLNSCLNLFRQSCRFGPVFTNDLQPVNITCLRRLWKTAGFHHTKPFSRLPSLPYSLDISDRKQQNGECLLKLCFIKLWFLRFTPSVPIFSRLFISSGFWLVFITPVQPVIYFYFLHSGLYSLSVFLDTDTFTQHYYFWKPNLISSQVSQ